MPKLMTKLALAIACLPLQLHAKTLVEVQMGGLQGSSCENTSREVITAGSVATIAVTVVSTDREVPFIGFPKNKPGWLTLEFCYRAAGDSFDASSVLFSMLNPEYFLEEEQIETNDLLKQGEDIDNSRKAPTYHFFIDIPEDLAGSTFCVRAALSPPPYGELRRPKSPYSDNLACLKVVGPCSREDEDNAHASRILLKRRMGKYEEALSMADSLVRTGWRSYAGLRAAVGIAREMKRFDSALMLLDIQFETYGSVGMRRTSDIPPFELIKDDPAAALNNYQSTRESLLHAKLAQEQKK